MSSAGCTGVGPRSGTHARPPPLASRWADSWVPRKAQFQGRNTDWSMKHSQGIQDDLEKLFERIEELLLLDRGVTTDGRGPFFTHRETWTYLTAGLYPGAQDVEPDACTHNKVELCCRGTAVQCTLRCKKTTDKTIFIQQKKNKGWAGWELYDEETRIDFKKAVMDQKGEAQNEDLETIQRGIEEVAKEIAHTTQSHDMKK